MEHFTTINKNKSDPIPEPPVVNHKKFCGKKVGISYRNFFVRDTSAYFPALLFSRRSPKKLRNVLSMKRSCRQTKEMSAHA